jgi:hypothetical protein
VKYQLPVQRQYHSQQERQFHQLNEKPYAL